MPTNLTAASSQRWDCGTQGSFGSILDDSAGFTMCGWLSTTQTSVASLMFSFSDGVEGGNQQSLWMFGNAGYTTDYVNSANSVLIGVDGTDDQGFVWHQTINSPDWNDGGIYHHALTCICAGSGSPASPAHTIVWYVNGQAFNSWTKPWNDAPNTLNNWTAAKAIGAGAKSGGIWFDHTTGGYEDWRNYSRALSSDEINQIYKMRGRDMIRNGLVSRYPFWTDGKNLGPNGTAATAVNSPTISATKYLSGTRRKVM